jgi:hypothetical protein
LCILCLKISDSSSGEFLKERKNNPCEFKIENCD